MTDGHLSNIYRTSIIYRTYIEPRPNIHNKSTRPVPKFENLNFPLDPLQISPWYHPNAAKSNARELPKGRKPEYMYMDRKDALPRWVGQVESGALAARVRQALEQA